MVDKQREYARLIRRGFSNSAACRQLGIDRKTGNWWKNGGVVTRGNATRVVQPILEKFAPNAEQKPGSGRYLSADERVQIADGVRAGLTPTAIAKELGRAVSTVTRELKRNVTPKGSYRPWSANEMAWARRSRPRKRLLQSDLELRELVQGYLDKRWSPEQIAHKLRTEHGRRIAVETIYQALYDPNTVLEREARVVLRTRRPHRRSRRRVDTRRPRFIVPISMIEDRPSEAENRSIPGHWEGDLIVGSYNRSAIGTLVERTTRFTILLPIDGTSRAETLRDQLSSLFASLPEHLRRSLTWDQGSEMALHHMVTQTVGMPVYFCRPGRPWQRGSNENTNGLLRHYFPKGTDLNLHSTEELQRISTELNQRPRKTLGWQAPQDLFTRLRAGAS